MILQTHFQFVLNSFSIIIFKMSDIEDDMDPINAMYTHGAMPDDANDAFSAVAKLGFGVEALPESTNVDVAGKDDTPPKPNKKTTSPPFSCKSHICG
jgi:hypothetical protein